VWSRRRPAATRRRVGRLLVEFAHGRRREAGRRSRPGPGM